MGVRDIGLKSELIIWREAGAGVKQWDNLVRFPKF